MRELRQKLKEARTENQTLRRLNFRQERALEKAEGAEADLPRLMMRHDEEVRLLHERARRYKEQLDSARQLARAGDQRLEQNKAQLARLRHLVERDDLKARGDLTRKVEDLANAVEERNAKIETLEKYIRNLENNFKAQLQRESSKRREAMQKCEEEERKSEELKLALQEKEKVVETYNMQAAIANRRNSRRISPMLALPAPEAMSEPASYPTSNSRDRIRLYDSQRRTSLTKQQRRRTLTKADASLMIKPETESLMKPDQDFEGNDLKRSEVWDEKEIEESQECETPAERDHDEKEEENGQEELRKTPEEMSEAASYQPTFLTALRCESASATMESRRDSHRWHLAEGDRAEVEAATSRRHRFRILQEAEEDEERRKEALLIRIRALDDKLNCREEQRDAKRADKNLLESSESSYTLPPVSPPSKATPEREKQLLVELFGEKALEEPLKPKPKLPTSGRSTTFEPQERLPLPWEVVVDLESDS